MCFNTYIFPMTFVTVLGLELYLNPWLRFLDVFVVFAPEYFINVGLQVSAESVA